MITKTLLLALSLLFGAGCASRTIETTATRLRNMPAQFSGARVAMENIRFFVSSVPAQVHTGASYDVGAAVSGRITSPSLVVVSGDPKDAARNYNLFAERRLYDALRTLSNGKVSSASRSEYEFERIDVISRFPDQKLGEAVALRTASFFLPPMANVKTHLECPYEVTYILRRGDKVVGKNTVSGLIKGNYKGWYVAGALEGKKLVEDLNAASEREVATQILNELYTAIDTDMRAKP